MLGVEVTSCYNSKYRVIKSYPMRFERPRHNGEIDTVQHIAKVFITSVSHWQILK